MLTLFNNVYVMYDIHFEMAVKSTENLETDYLRTL
jgi:hypothetical protein